MIALTNVTKPYGRRVPLIDASFQLNPGGESVGVHGWPATEPAGLSPS
jgi:hypothetical protein